MSQLLKKMSKSDDSQEKPWPKPPKTPQAIKSLEKTTRTTNEWLSYIFWALVAVNVLLVGILLRSITN